MRPLKVTSGVAIAALCALWIGSSACDGRASIEVTLDLSDGSRVIGTPKFKNLDVNTEFGELTIPLEKVMLVTFSNDELRTAKVRLKNGDAIQGEAKAERFKLTTEYGELEIAREIVDSMSVRTYLETGGAGLIAYYPFEDDAVDSSGHHHDGTIYDASTTKGRVGSALHFDGRSSVRVANPVISDTPVSVALWFKSDGYSQANRYLLSNGGQTGASQGIALFIAGSSHVRKYALPSEGIGFFVADQSSQFRALLIYPVSHGEWHHIVVTWSGAPNLESISMYIDGRQVEAVPWQQANTSTFGPVQHLVIGQPSNTSDFGYRGDIDEVRIYNRVLSQSQVKTLYDSYE